MIYLFQNKTDYDYDVRALALTFFEREKIVAVYEDEYSTLFHGNETNALFLKLIYDNHEIKGTIASDEEDMCQESVECDYTDHALNRNKVCRFLYHLFSNYTKKTLPWGILTGIRPTKIIMKWMEEEKDPKVLEQKFMDTYLADRQKASLCRRVALKEKKLLSGKNYPQQYSLYIGIPFCPTTCLYCSFTSFPVKQFGNRMKPYLEALYRELKYVSKTWEHKELTTIYVGGGTPTALDEGGLYTLLSMIRELFPVEKIQEFTVEAGRPDSINQKKLSLLKEAGVGRISINPQTMHQKTLDLIGRKHTVEQTKNGFYMAREAGFQNINMDMITGLPGEDLSFVHGTLDEIFALKPESLTVHSLAIKRAANLNIEMERYKSLVKGSTNEMLRLTDEYCSRMGMEPYYMYRQKNIPGNLENIGYSLPGKECLYNILIMEEKQDIIACGAGASTKFVYNEENRIERTENVKNIDHYINRIDEMIDRKRKFALS